MLKLLCISIHSLDFLKFYHYAKFCRNHSNRGQDIVIFASFKMAAAAILDFQNLKILTFGTVKSVELRNHAKFCQNRSNRGRDIAIFRIFKMADAAMLDF